MFHQIKGTNIADILRDQEIMTTPRFCLAGKTQQELESELTPRRGKHRVLLYNLSIKRAEGGIDLLIWEKGERPVVWLTLAEKPIASIWRLGNATFQEAESSLKGFFRIGIDTSKVEVFPWREYEQRAGVSKHWRRILAEAACGDDTSKWYFSLAPISSSGWTVIERWDISQWVPWQAESAPSDTA